ncbi:unnamed protein product [Oppiella nova]|uniref:Uncharacterized protein n=1 Tax=Oppiella nova TaxID=334625 RepID=A0A7R9MG20_9ACAR|nr:unnamed protein product [Oppiella nova]CAG2176725.1 unnamed protein product [Oppiella nova]
MADGRVAFMGSIGDAKNFFSSQELQICDNYLDSGYSDITINANENNTRGTPTLNKPILRSGYRAGYWRQFVTLLWRSYITLIRNPQLLLDRFVMYLYVHTVKGELRQCVYHHGKLIRTMGVMGKGWTSLEEQSLMYREHHNRMLLSCLTKDLGTVLAILPVLETMLNYTTRVVELGPEFIIFILRIPISGNISPINTTNTTQSTTTYTSGVEVIESQGFDESALMWCPFALMAWALVYMFVAYIGLCRKVRRKQ